MSLGFTFPDDIDWRAIYAKAGGCLGACGCFSPVAVLLWRIVLFIVWLVCVVWSLIDWVEDYDVGYYFTKLTYWGAILELLYFLLLACTTCVAVLTYGKKGASTGTPCYVSVTWALGSAMPSVTLTIFILYWTLVYEEDDDIEAISVVVHGGNWVIMLLDFLTTRQPFLLRHVYVPMILGIIYSLFTLVYYLADGTNEDGFNTYIYEALDWEDDTGTTIVTLLLAVFVGIPAFHLAHWPLRCCAGYSEDSKQVHPQT